ncbi:MAG: FAD-dependent oxidoreductase [Mesorhizobium sp.]|nr:MAG: FAD-dependent oxidoreductase [Mesorhizobium sp.]
MGSKDVLVVGAGFAGAVYARTLAEAGYLVTVIDRRDHVAGNAFDYTELDGTRVHRYGPHLFHTSSSEVLNWIMKFGRWGPYEHRVRALLPNNSYVPLPVNRTTIEAVFHVTLQNGKAVRAFLKRQAESVDIVRNAADYLHMTIGVVLTNLFFRQYTKKMWGTDLEELDPYVVKRIPIGYDDDDRYFPFEKYQMMPLDGYTKLFEEILSHERIKLFLKTPFCHDMRKQFHYSFLSSSIDEYFDYCYGYLPYRSIKFCNIGARRDKRVYWTQTNFTDDRPQTRQTNWWLIPEHAGEAERTTITTETPCDFRDNNFERYYPVLSSDAQSRRTYQKYRTLADRDSRIQFVGRCGLYRYLDMHQVIDQSLSGAKKWIEGEG